MRELNDAPRVTVLTTTYNRANTLPRLYESLSKQEYCNFEWLIIDDGSVDGTPALVQKWQDMKQCFCIRYFWYENRGRHVAINRGMEKAKGEFCSVVDSDDWYPATGLSDLVQAWQSIPEDIRPQYANVEGLCVSQDGSLIGSKFPEDIFDSDNFKIRIYRKKYGDTRGMYRTEILKKFPYPEEPKYVLASLVWNRIAEKYRTRFINKVVGFIEYQEGGLSRSSLGEKIKRGESSILYHQELLRMKRRLPLKVKKNAVVTIACRGMHYRKNLLELFCDTNEKILFAIFFPIALARFLRQKLKIILVEKGLLSL